MPKADRKAAIAAFKERASVPGIFAVRCAATGEVWLGQSRNLGAQKTGLWFSLNNGGHPNRDLLARWKERGEAAFSFEVIEALEPESSAVLLTSLLRDRLVHWVKLLNAQRVS
jgi:hypothetical protein